MAHWFKPTMGPAPRIGIGDAALPHAMHTNAGNTLEHQGDPGRVPPFDVLHGDEVSAAGAAFPVLHAPVEAMEIQDAEPLLRADLFLGKQLRQG
jgi:hypothetical protein